MNATQTAVTGLADEAAVWLGEAVPALQERSFLGNTLSTWVVAGVLAACAFVVLLTVRAVLLGRARAFAASHKSPAWDLAMRLVLRTSVLIVAAISLRIGVAGLTLSETMTRVVSGVVIVLVALQVAIWLTAVVDWALVQFLRKKKAESDPTAALNVQDEHVRASLAAVRFLVLLASYAIILMVTLDNFNVDVTAMVAGLGIGGLAVALAVQNILGDVFGSLSITFDKPFEVGDFIIVGDKLGTVEKIGIKTTRVRALSGEQLIFTNSDLLSSRIQNFKRMRERRAVFGFGVEYSTPPETLEEIVRSVREIVSSDPGVRLDRAHFKGFGASSLDFEIVYWMKNPEYAAFMETQQKFNLAIMRRLNELGVSFAFPTQTLHVASLPKMT